MRHYTQSDVHEGRVEVEAAARLHLGFFDLSIGANERGARRFGSFGLAIDRPCTRLTIRRSPVRHIEGPDLARIARHLSLLEPAIGAGPHDVRIDAAIPSHAGLGSGTQLALALAAGLRRLHDRAPDIAADARRTGRGHRSGIGIGLFETGGLVADGGRGPETLVPPVLARMPFPEAWRIVLVFDPDRSGVHGMAETAAFEALPPMPRGEAADICRLVLMQALPAVAECDIVAFGAAVRTVQRLLGGHFAPRQGGRAFTSARVSQALDFLDAAGAHGTGQSSWGPTGFAFCADETAADVLARDLRHRFAADGLDIHIVRGLNRGARISMLAPVGQ